MVTEFQREKFTRRFRLLDLDGDGYIDEADYEMLARKMIAASGSAGQPARVGEIHSAYHKLWSRMCSRANIDTDARISQEEFVHACVGSVVEQPGGFDWIIQPSVEAILVSFDTDGDGHLGAEEFQKWLRANGVGEYAAKEVLDRLDHSGDGRISAEEFITAAREFYLSEDPEAPGNWIFGAA